jgi:hypothetical protein
MAKKMTGESEERQDEILHQLDESKPHGHVAVSGGVLTDSACDDYGKQFQMCIVFFHMYLVYLLIEFCVIMIFNKNTEYTYTTVAPLF